MLPFVENDNLASAYDLRGVLAVKRGLSRSRSNMPSGVTFDGTDASVTWNSAGFRACGLFLDTNPLTNADHLPLASGAKKIWHCVAGMHDPACDGNPAGPSL